MYLEHFGFAETPFTLTPATKFYYPAERAQQTLASVLAAINRHEGIIKITGEVGTGKTMLCRMLLAALDGKANTAYLAMPATTPAALFTAVLKELHGTCAADEEPQAALQRHLLALAETGRHTVLLMDEAQAFGWQGLEAIRLLSNLETERQKLITIVLFGQPELDNMLARPNLRQIQQRIAFSFMTAPLSDEESIDYLSHRLVQASRSHSRALGIFSRSAIRTLARAGNGTPRVLNILADKSLLHAFSRGAPAADTRDIKAALSDQKSPRASGIAHWYVFALLALIAGLVAYSHFYPTNEDMPTPEIADAPPSE